MKIYLAGRITGTSDYHARFARHANRLRLRGHSVYNPAAANLEGLSRCRIMSHLLPILCEQDAIAMIPGWWRSGGARIEWLLAKYLHKKIIYL